RTPHSFPTRRSSDLHFPVVEIENGQHFVASIPAPHRQHTVFFETYDVHFFFAQITERRKGFPKMNQLAVVFEHRLMSLFFFQSRSEEHTSELQSRGH